jgi:LysM repeat protein
MQSLRQIGAGFLLSLLSLAAVIGGFALSQAESHAERAVPSPTTVRPSETVVTVFPTIPVLTNTPQVLQPVSSTETPIPTYTVAPSLTPPPPPVSCLPPSGWQAILVQDYETLAYLAQKYQTSADQIKQGNCLFSDQLMTGSFLYVPSWPTATVVPCGAPVSWVYYIVVPGDTLYNLSLRYRTTVGELQRANCLGSSTYLQANSRLKVPNVPPLLPSATVFIPTGTASPTLVPPTATLSQPSATLTSAQPTAVPPTAVPTTVVPPTTTLTPAPTPTTPAPPTLTPEPSATASPTPSQTPSSSG